MKKPSKTYLQEKSWEEKAQENPLYGVMSHEEFSESGAEPTQEQLDIFYSRGDEMVSAWIQPWLEDTQTSSEMLVLEFGCGMGRLTNALAKLRAPNTIAGVDISKTMVSHAKKNTAEGIRHETILDDGKFPFHDSEFDRIYSYAVFQHIANKSVIESSIREIARILKKGGEVKLNFEMIFNPENEKSFLQDTHALEDKYIVYGWKKKAGIPLWRVRVNQSNNWGGNRLGYKQLKKLFSECGIQIKSIATHPGSKGMVWFAGVKSQ